MIEEIGVTFAKKKLRKVFANAGDLVEDIVKKRGAIKEIRFLTESKNLASDFFIKTQI